MKKEIAVNPLLCHLHVCVRSVSAARNSLHIPNDIEWVLFCDDDGYLMDGYSKKFFEEQGCRPWVEVIAGVLFGMIMENIILPDIE